MQLGGKDAMVLGIEASIEWAKDRCMAQSTSVNEVEYRFLLQGSIAQENAKALYAKRPLLFKCESFEYVELYPSPQHRVRLDVNKRDHVVESIEKRKMGVYYHPLKAFVVAHAHEVPVEFSLTSVPKETVSQLEEQRRLRFHHRHAHFTVDVSERLLEIEVCRNTKWDLLQQELLALSVILRLDKFKGDLPQALTADNADKVSRLRAQYAVSVKYDGLRVLMCAFRGVDFMVLLARNLRVVHLVVLKSAAAASLVLDGEWCSQQNQCVLFDCLKISHCADASQLPLQDRCVLLQRMIDRIEFPDNNAPHLSVKQFYSLTGPGMHDLMQAMKSDPLPNDGLIITPVKPRPTLKTYKWKPLDRLTFDFRLTALSHNDGVFGLVCAERDGQERQYGHYTAPKGGDTKAIAGDIVECVFDTASDSFHVLTKREDKQRPNYIDVIEETMSCLNAALTLNDLQAILIQKSE